MRDILRGFWLIITSPFRLIWWLVRGTAGAFRRVFRDIGSFFTEEPEDSPVTDAFSKAIDNPQDILFHLNVLRKHLLRAIVMLFITTVLSFIFTRQVLELLARPLDGGMDALQAIDVTEPIGVFMRVALLTGFAIALPYITLELWLFAAPGLGRRSRIYGLLAIPAVTLFFLGGMAFAYFVMLPTALPFLVNFMGFQTAPRPSTYFPFVTGLMFWLGVIFEFPLVIYILASIGIIRADTLMKQSRLALVILSIVAAAITPTVDPISMLLVWGPLVLLYFLGVGLAYLAQGRRRVEREDLPRVSASD